jgi:peptidyl-prolyl cis-trans isomerase SurA
MRTGKAGLLLTALVMGSVGLAGGQSPATSGQAPSVPARSASPGGLIEGVAAVVGDTPILRSEVEEQFVTLAPQFQVDPSDSSQANQLRREILDNLISEQLLTQEAEALGLKVDDATINDAVSQAVESDRARLGAEGFAAQLKKEGITETELRARYSQEARQELLRRNLLQKEVFAKVAVTDAQVLQSFQQNKEKIGKKPRALRVLDLFVRTTPDSLIEQSQRKRAEDIRKEIVGGVAFDEAAKKYSDDEKSRPQGGLLPPFSPGDLGDRSFEQVAFTLPVGEVSRPIRTNLGYHIIQVVNRDEQSQTTQIRHILIKVTPTRADESRIRAKVDSIRDEIASGKLDFAEAVRRYSNDSASRAAGGDVGWLAIDNFLGDTRGAVDSLRMGAVSRVAEVEGGYHIFKLTGEQAETDYAFDDIKDELRGMAERDERQKRLETYLKELRSRYYVEVRPMGS